MAFSAQLAPELTTIALCWRVARVDGVVLGYTSHDAPIDVDGLRYEASPGMTPSAISDSLGLDVATMEFAGALTAASMTEEDLAAGRFDAAQLTIFMVDWAVPAAGTLAVARGTLGAVARDLTAGVGGFTATVRGPTAALDALAIESCTPTCRAELGDFRCRVDLAPLTTLAVAAAGSACDQVSVPGLPSAERYIDGRLRCLDGANTGLDRRITATEGDTLYLIESFPSAVGGRVELREGCDKRLATCAARFGNTANFRGEPQVPGTDVLTRFPGV